MRETPIPDEIPALMGIRGPACAAVVAFHLHPVLFLLFPARSGSFNELGSAMVAVDFFFMLSGFVIAHNYLDDLAVPRRRAVAHYLVLRIARIWPLHAAMVLAFLGYHLLSRATLGYGLDADMTPANVVANLVMLHEFAPFSAINTPSWSMAPELGAYLAFPLLAPLLFRVRRALVALVLLGVLLTVGVAVLSARYAELGPEDWSRTVAWIRVAVSFPAGCLVAVLWRGLPARLRSHGAWDVVAAGAALAAVVVCVGLNRGPEFREPVITYPLLAVVVLGCAGASGPLARLLSTPWVHGSGRLSYAVYLTHFLVVVAAFSVLARHGAGDWSALARVASLAVVVVVVIVVGWGAHAFVEEPARRALRRAAPHPESLPARRSAADSLTA